MKLAVIDHVASFPPVLFDVKGLSSLCKGAGAKGAAQDILVTGGEDAVWTFSIYDAWLVKSLDSSSGAFEASLLCKYLYHNLPSP